MNDNEKLTEEQKALVKAGVKEFMDQVYRNVGRGVLEKLFWIAVGLLLMAYFGGHLPK